MATTSLSAHKPIEATMASAGYVIIWVAIPVRSSHGGKHSSRDCERENSGRKLWPPRYTIYRIYDMAYQTLDDAAEHVRKTVMCTALQFVKLNFICTESDGVSVGV